jgi:hypothetical protein
VTQIYEYAVIYEPDEKAVELGDKPVLIVDVKRVLAGGESEAQILAARDIPEEYIGKLDQVTVAIRPF